MDDKTAIQQIKSTIIKLAEESIDKQIDISNYDNIIELGILDSPAIIQLIATVERMFNINVEEEEINIDNFGSINQILSFIKNK